MINHRITHTAAVALAIAAAGAPIASADPAPYRDGYEPITAEARQDLRHPDTRDYAEGRGSYNSPDVVVIDSPAPAAEPTSTGGVDWADVGIGAGGVLAVSLIGLGGALAVVHRRGTRQLAS
jgi:hypothetical protein